MPQQTGIYFKDEGKGFPVILIHGFCETREIWNSFSRNLSKEFRVLSIDLPGFGGSPILPGSFSIEDVASKVLEWMHTMRIDSCVVIGHSLGGYVTLAMAGQQPKVVKGFSLFQSTAYPDSDEKKISRDKVMEFVSTNGVAPFIKSFIPPLFYNQSNPHVAEVVKLALTTKKESLISYVRAMRDRPNHTDVITSFKGPILFISGEKDGVVSPENMEKQSKMAINPRLHVMLGVAHMGMFENEAEALGIVVDFLRADCK